ncbi:MAG: hypothetical protein ABSF84_06095 [Acidimicrobiales bacterium]|jgi:iron uptake system EfeUOB component EfeO/EfeM
MSTTDPPSDPSGPHRGRRSTATLTLAVLATLAAGCASTTVRSPTSAAPVRSAPAGDPAVAAAARAATTGFALDVDRATDAFVGAVDALRAAAASGDTSTAEADELSAQADYDSFRALETGDAVNAATLDELSSDVLPEESFGGLHAVERDLWTSGPLAEDVSSLAGQAPVARLLLARERLGPEAIGAVAVDQLDWVVDVALPDNQERYSGLGLVDVDATVEAAQQSFSTIEPLARQVDPTLTATVAGQFADLAGEVAALGAPTSVQDSDIPGSIRLALSEELDATATSVARLAAALVPSTPVGARS